jgi:TBC1 domain family protein 5
LLIVIPSDYSEQLTCLLRYPGHATPDLDHATPHPSSLLLRQALALQLSPTPATGASLVVENRNFLHIPSDVPEPPPPPPRRKGRPAPTHQKVASDTASPSTETTGAKSGAFGTVRNTHLKQLSQQAQNMGLPDIARGLLDRGESFGINKTNFFSAVSELRVCFSLNLS